ncbi:MAG: hypothetical protein WCP07_00795 [bacterium]|jgi:hypothetical protein
MKKNRLAVMAIFSLGLLAGAAQAQDASASPAQPPATATQSPANGTRQGGRFGGQRGAMQMPYKTAFKAINPTPEQQTKFDALEKTMMADLTELRDVAPEERRGKMQEASTKFEKGIEALLTPEQLPVYKDALEKERKRAQGGPMAQLEALNLTPEQKKQIEPIVKDTMAEIQKARQDRTGDRQTQMQQMMGILAGMKSKIRPLLTPAQQKQLDAMQLGMGGRGGGRGGRNSQ